MESNTVLLLLSQFRHELVQYQKCSHITSRTATLSEINKAVGDTDMWEVRRGGGWEQFTSSFKSFRQKGEFNTHLFFYTPKRSMGSWRPAGLLVLTPGGSLVPEMQLKKPNWQCKYMMWAILHCYFTSSPCKFNANCIVNPRAMNTVAHLSPLFRCRSRAKYTLFITVWSEIVGLAHCNAPHRL